MTEGGDANGNAGTGNWNASVARARSGATAVSGSADGHTVVANKSERGFSSIGSSETATTQNIINAGHSIFEGGKQKNDENIAANDSTKRKSRPPPPPPPR